MKWIILFMIFAGAVSAQQKPFAELKKENNEIPKGYYHDNYYPNPFCPATIAKFGIPDTCTVRLFLTDSLNARVTDTLFTGSLPPGNYEYNFFKIIKKYKGKGLLRGHLYIETFEERKKSLHRVTNFKASRALFWFW